MLGISRIKFRTDVKARDFLDCGQAWNERSSLRGLAAASVPVSEPATIFDDEELTELFAELPGPAHITNGAAHAFMFHHIRFGRRA
jgi:hypothetical protein